MNIYYIALLIIGLITFISIGIYYYATISHRSNTTPHDSTTTHDTPHTNHAPPTESAGATEKAGSHKNYRDRFRGAVQAYTETATFSDFRRNFAFFIRRIAADELQIDLNLNAINANDQALTEAINEIDQLKAENKKLRAEFNNLQELTENRWKKIYMRSKRAEEGSEEEEEPEFIDLDEQQINPNTGRRRLIKNGDI